MDIKQIIGEALSEEENLLKIYSKGVDRYVPGNAILFHGGAHHFYLEKCKDPETQKTLRRYVPCRDAQKIRRLANSMFYRLHAEISHSNIRILKTALKHIKSHEPLYKRCDRGFSEYADTCLLSKEAQARLWAAEDYPKNSYPFNNSTNYETKKGDRVRSKAELIVANWLWDHNIPYRYEAELFLNGETYPIYPDFTILSPHSLEPIYLEYFGMMTDPTYCTDMLKRINKYAADGIVLGKNLIALFEGDGVPMNSSTVSATLKQLL